ncbi:uncharacterized protein MELLADRAFT_91219 [Melampsora larici-populina 98AG31]|uniref:Uncharacterized protein n=1 Tax=Melampsora larici-populina (strain 98AG31 / pathotype 3-4-7) TaxID=747676 RepID=F4RY91_MELLP|nr:uncharacterized protein MELLADRAFT_91219 [Melampsora larici-populina 98AG31]EGG02679.1 hypothetical protein MELLADRAFT_91219 [Melampsora larici-populina 98AG31]
MVLASKAIPGQFEALFWAFTQWKLDFQTETIKTQASDGRQAVNPKIPQSTEGNLITKAQAEAAKVTLKQSRALEKVKSDAAKASLKQAHALEKELAEEAKAQAKGAHVLERKQAAKVKQVATAARPQGQAGSSGFTNSQTHDLMDCGEESILGDSPKRGTAKGRGSLPKRARGDNQGLIPPLRSPPPHCSTTITHSWTPNKTGRIDLWLYQPKSI